jgi:hypothetical protein
MPGGTICSHAHSSAPRFLSGHVLAISEYSSTLTLLGKLMQTDAFFPNPQLSSTNGRVRQVAVIRSLL